MGPAAVARGLGEGGPGDSGGGTREGRSRGDGTEDEKVVQKLPSHRAHPALGEGIGPRSPEGQPDYPNALASEDLVEESAKLCGAASD